MRTVREGLTEEETAEQGLIGAEASDHVAIREPALREEAAGSAETRGGSVPAGARNGQETWVRGAEEGDVREVTGPSRTSGGL